MRIVPRQKLAEEALLCLFSGGNGFVFVGAVIQVVPLALKIDVCDIFAIFSARHTAHTGGVVSRCFVRRYPADVGAVNLPELIGNGLGC